MARLYPSPENVVNPHSPTPAVGVSSLLAPAVGVSSLLDEK